MNKAIHDLYNVRMRTLLHNSHLLLGTFGFIHINSEKNMFHYFLNVCTFVQSKVHTFSDGIDVLVACKKSSSILHFASLKIY